MSFWIVGVLKTRRRLERQIWAKQHVFVLISQHSSWQVCNGKDEFGFSTISDLPCYVRNKFQHGFPDDWKEVKLMWKEYINQGELRYKMVTQIGYK
jgi:hypothetical protein